LDTTTVLLLEVDPESLRFEDDAVVFSSPSRQQVTQRGGAREPNKHLLLLLWSGLLHHFQGL
jgi:hypothetical protein